MALIFMDGFDHYTTAATMAYKWDSVATSYVTANNSGRRAGSHAVSNGNGASGYMRKNFGANLATVTVGFALNVSALPTGSRAYAKLLDLAAAPQLSFLVGVSGLLIVTRGDWDGTTLATSTAAIAPGTWNYIEIKATIADSGGTVEVKLNGASVISFTGDTKATTNASATVLQLGGAVTSAPICYYDDLYICDTSGSVNTTFLGDVRVDTLYPTGAGNSTQFTPSTGANWENVDDSSPDGDSTYNSGDTAGYKDTFAFGDLSISSTTIHGLQTNICARKDDAGARTMTDVVRTASTDYTGGTTHSLADSYLNYRTVRELNPNTSAAWAVSEVNGAEFGYTVTA